MQVGAEFVGYADVVISHVEQAVPLNYRIQAYLHETVTGSDGKPSQRLIDSRDLHFVGDIAVPSAQYWADKQTGESRMNSVFAGINHDYARQAAVIGRHGPVGQLDRAVEKTQLIDAVGEQLSREDPSVAIERADILGGLIHESSSHSARLMARISGGRH